MPNEILKSTVSYEFDGREFAGLLFSANQAERRPGVLIVHTWLGIDPSIQKRAQRVAELGYNAFVVDLFGPGVLPKSPHDSMQAILPFINNRQYFRDGLKAGLDAFVKLPQVDSSQIAAIGYCFGGCGVLEMARAGFDLKGVVSLHGELNTTLPAQKNTIKGRVLVLHGDADVVVKSDTVTDFMNEMRNSQAGWEFTSYSGAKHSFTGEGVAGKNTPEAGLDETAESRSWASMSDFLSNILVT